MRVLVIGSGAREHALVARLAVERDVGELVAAPGNPGIASLARTAGTRVDDVEGLLELAAREQIDLTVVGPELPLSLGLADRFAAEGLLLFGPSALAARLESSKAFAKAFMARHQVPTARFRTCASIEEARKAIAGDFKPPVVIKADGLAAGKGVVVAGDAATAEDAVVAAMGDRRFGDAGDCLVIEECLTGPEVSFFAVCDGEPQRLARHVLHHDPGDAIMLDDVMDGDHARVVQPRRGLRLARGPRQQAAPLGPGQVRGQEDLLDRDIPVQYLIMTAPDAAHAALANGLG